MSELAESGIHYSPELLTSAHGPEGYLRSFDLRSELDKISAPTMIVAGRYDWICAPEFSQEIHDLVGGSQLHIFENSGHSVAGDEPELLCRLIADFVGTEPEAKQ